MIIIVSKGFQVLYYVVGLCALPPKNNFSINRDGLSHFVVLVTLMKCTVNIETEGDSIAGDVMRDSALCNDDKLLLQRIM